MRLQLHADLCSLKDNQGEGRHVVDVIIKKLHSKGKIVLTVGSSALATSLHERSRTAHNLFEIPVIKVHPFHYISWCILTFITRITLISAPEFTQACIMPSSLIMRLPSYGKNCLALR